MKAVYIVLIILMFARISAQGKEGLAAHYNFDEGSGSVLKDISRNGNDGKINGAEFVPLKDGYALKSDPKFDTAGD